MLQNCERLFQKTNPLLQPLLLLLDQFIKHFGLLFSHLVTSGSLPPKGLQHARPPCSSLCPGVCSNSCPLSQWYHPTISSSVAPFSSCPSSTHYVLGIVLIVISVNQYNYLRRHYYFSILLMRKRQKRGENHPQGKIWQKNTGLKRQYAHFGGCIMATDLRCWMKYWADSEEGRPLDAEVLHQDVLIKGGRIRGQALPITLGNTVYEFF